MAVNEYHCLNGADDETTGWGADATDDTIFARYNRLGGDEISIAEVHLDTSAIGTDVISAATLHWYTVSNTKFPKAETYSHYIQVSGISIFSSTAEEPAGWASHGLTAGELSLINKSGDTDIRFRVNTPSVNNIRTWTLRAYEFVPVGTFSVYLEVTHAPAAGGPTKMTIIGV